MIDQQASVLQTINTCDDFLSLQEIFNLNKDVASKLELLCILKELYADAKIAFRVIDGISKYGKQDMPIPKVSASKLEASIKPVAIEKNSLALSEQPQSTKTIQSAPIKSHAATKKMEQILNLLEERGGWVLSSGIALMFGISGGADYLKTYIREGLVELDKTGGYGNTAVRLKPGITASACIAASKFKQNSGRPKNAVLPKKLAPVAISQDKRFEPPQFIKENLQVPQTIRFAMTSDKTLLIMGLKDSPIELDAATTKALDEFMGYFIWETA